MASIRSAGCLIIGDEVLNGKILDTNSYEMAKYCFNSLAIPLKRTIVCGDDKNDIVESLRRLQSDKCDFIVTSGGIGSTHDDITYEALAAAFGTSCALDEDTVSRMHTLRGSKLEKFSKLELNAFYKMATLPKPSPSLEVLKLFTYDSLWVPIVGLNNQVYVLPGVPELFKKLLTGLGESIKPRIVENKQLRYFVLTRSSESHMAGFLSDLQDAVDLKYGAGKVKIGSYPHMTWGTVTISVIGDTSVPETELREIVAKVVENVGGEAKEISADEEDHITRNDPSPAL